VHHEGSHLDPLERVAVANVLRDLLESHLALACAVGGAEEGCGTTHRNAAALKDRGVTGCRETHELPSAHAASENGSIIATLGLEDADNLTRITVVVADDSDQGIFREALQNLIDIRAREPVNT